LKLRFVFRRIRAKLDTKLPVDHVPDKVCRAGHALDLLPCLIVAQHYIQDPHANHEHQDDNQNDGDGVFGLSGKALVPSNNLGYAVRRVLGIVTDTILVVLQNICNTEELRQFHYSSILSSCLYHLHVGRILVCWSLGQ
jgi:hypothetical protein